VLVLRLLDKIEPELACADRAKRQHVHSPHNENTWFVRTGGSADPERMAG